MLEGRKVLFTGATGQALRPAAEVYAAANEVWCAARFSDPEVRAQLEAAGIVTFPWTMGEGSLDGLPDDFTHVVHAAPYRGQPSSNHAAQANAVGAGSLLHHCRDADAFVFISTFAVYAKPPAVDHPVAETDPLGGHAPYAPSYPVGKMAAEGAVRAFASVFGLPVTVARLNVCYGPTGWGGLPVELFERMLAGEPIWVPADGHDVWCSPISTDDVTGFLEPMFAIASPGTTIVNLAGDEAVTVREFCLYLARRAGIEVRFESSDGARDAWPSDNTRRRQVLGSCRVTWKQGMMEAVEAHFPGAFDSGQPRPIPKVRNNIWGQR